MSDEQTTGVDEAAESTPAGGGVEAIIESTLLGGFGAVVPTDVLGRAVGALFRNPLPIFRATVSIPGRLAAVALRGEVAPDPRFADPAWLDNPLFARLAGGYLTVCDAVLGTVDALDTDWRTREQVRQSLDNLLAATSPANNPLMNPQVFKEVRSSGGTNLVRGVQNLANDWRTASKLPASVDRSAVVFGKTIAATAGKVVRRGRLYELIEYAPTTSTVDATPTVLIASPVNKYYLVDLAPEKSVVRAELNAGRRVFVLSWVNPDASHADAGYTAYGTAVIEALETAAAICGTNSCHPVGLCGGAQITLIAAAYLASVGRQELLATLTIAIAVTDFSAGPAGSAFLDKGRVKRAIDKAHKKGYFDAVETARSFAMMRPVDGIWLAMVHRYLLGRPAPPHHLLSWAADQTNLTAQLGADMLEMALNNGLATPGGIVVERVPLDTSRITVPTYVLGASTDHISPWRDSYRTIGMIGHNTEYVLATGGHAAAIAKGPGSPRASYRTGGIAFGIGPDQWLADSELHTGAWWDHWNAWATGHAPETVPAPTEPGNDEFPPIDDAPGQYIRRVLT